MKVQKLSADCKVALQPQNEFRRGASIPVIKENVEFGPVRTLHGVHPVLFEVDVVA